MHIPDGYLSPSTAASLFAGATPFWYVALRRVRKELNTRTIPLLSVFSAFSFVIMMFNLPLPGGTTGHAVGMGIAAIVLGPWVSILAISIALFIQAFFFGDGGITAFGANCFNMAIVGSLVAFVVYRSLAYGAALTGSRRLFAAAVAGYAAINASAFCAAVELGIQPLLFRDASGAPLYAPYPLTVSIPAMMIGHLTFAGLAELVLSAGVVQYLQRADPAMLRRTAPEAPVTESESAWKTSRNLWLGLALLLLLTPLGILAVGTAWGEWRISDFANPSAREQIAAASSNHAPPAHIPQGLQHLSSIWKAPVADYAPAFVRSASAAYLVSAVIGVTLIVAISLLIAQILYRSGQTRKRRKSFIETTIQGLLAAMQEALFAEDIAGSTGFLQSLDARLKLLGVGALILAAVAVHPIWLLFLLFGVGALLAVVSGISLTFLCKRIWLPVLTFTGVIALPAFFLVPGHSLFRIPLVGWPVTSQGVTSAALLTMRAETASTFSCLLVLTTPWNHLLRSLRFFRIPIVLVVIVESTYRFVFLLLQSAQNMLESRQTRLVGRLRPSQQRRFAAASVGVLLDKTVQLSGNVHTAMRARGFRGEAMLLDDLKLEIQDWLQLAIFLAIACAAIWLGR
ncbi:MAG: cobalt transporter CbiM [Acidobacteriota bacterium]|nr:cobalt transporter CbiM [Acidobacteriota bacterium]